MERVGRGTHSFSAGTNGAGVRVKLCARALRAITRELKQRNMVRLNRCQFFSRRSLGPLSVAPTPAEARVHSPQRHPQGLPQKTLLGPPQQRAIIRQTFGRTPRTPRTPSCRLPRRFKGKIVPRCVPERDPAPHEVPPPHRRCRRRGPLRSASGRAQRCSRRCRQHGA